MRRSKTFAPFGGRPVRQLGLALAAGAALALGLAPVAVAQSGPTTHSRPAALSGGSAAGSTSPSTPRPAMGRDGTISGFVVDGGHGPVGAGECVEAAPLAGGAGTTVVVRPGGSYAVGGLPAGSYRLTAAKCSQTAALSPATGGRVVRLQAGQHLSWIFLSPTSPAPARPKVAPAASFGVSSPDLREALPQQTSTTGDISGTVTDAASGAGLSGICVVAGSTSATTGTGGTYTISGLAAGSYIVTFEDGCGNTSTYAVQYYPGMALITGAASVSVAAGATTTGIDAALQPGGTITGTVTDASSGAAVAGICVSIPAGESASTGTSGTYSIVGVPLGGTTVAFNTCPGPTDTYQTQGYPNVTLTSAEVPVVLSTGGQTISGINDALAQQGAISGTVTDASTGTGISGICVIAAPDQPGGTVGNVSPLLAVTASNGTYTISGLDAGSYQVTFTQYSPLTTCGSTGGYASQYYPGVYLASGVRSVQVAAGTTVSGINASMVAAGSISGTVSPATAGVCVTAQPTAGAPSVAGYSVSATTGTNGSYDISLLPPGSYEVSFSAGCGYSGPMVTTYYNGALGPGTATPIQLAAGQNVTGIDDTLSAGGSISGTVTASGSGLSGICVDAFASDGQSGFATTGSGGTYTMAGLGAGSYIVDFYSGCGGTGNYASQYYSGATSEASATPVTVTDGQTTANINATLTAQSLANLNLTVTLGSSPLPGWGVCLIFGQGGGALGSSNGTLSLTGLAPGPYTLTLFSSSLCGSYGNYVAQSISLTLSSGQTLSQTVNLPAGATIQGSVTNQSGTGLGDVCVLAVPTGSSATTSTYFGTEALSQPTGAYQLIGVPAGTYVVQFATSECSPGLDYATQFYSGAVSGAQATTLTVAAGSTTTGISATMSPGADISGVVTDTSGNWLMGICVYAYSSTGVGQLVGADYYYQITGLPAGSYTVAFFTGCGQYPPDVAYQYYNDAGSPTLATPVGLTTGQSRTGIDAVMGPGGAISGTVVDTSGSPVAGICVYWGNNAPISGVTGADGTYTLEGLPAGSAIVEFTSGCGSTTTYPSQYYNGVSSPAAATPVPVTAGQTTPNINATMGAISSGAPGAPGTPTGLAEPSAVSLSWAAPSSSGTSAITGYEVTPYVGGVAQPALQTGSSQTSYTVTGLTDNTAYTFTVAAENASGAGPQSSASTAVTPVAPPPATYNPLTPYRVCDTRPGNPSGLSGLDLTQCEGKTLNAATTLTIQVAGTNPSGQSTGGVPSSATSVILNVTVTDTTAPSFLTVWPAGGARPLSSSVNWAGGQVVANLVTVAVGSGGAVSLYNDAGNVDVVVDVEGWMDSTGASGGPYVPLSPYRICDTRPPTLTPQNQCTGKTLQTGTTLNVQVTGTSPLSGGGTGVPSSGVLAVDLTVTATDTTAPSFLTVWPAGASQPVASNVNFVAGQTVANNVVVAVPQSGADAGMVSIFNAQGSADVVVDVSGYYATSQVTGAAKFTPMVPYRICDTRPTAISGLVDACTGHTLQGGTALMVQVAGVGGIPATATSVVLNVTVTDTSVADFLTIYPAGTSTPNSSNLNWAAGQTVASGVTATLGSNGALDFFIPHGSADLVVDVVGWEQ